MIVQTLECGEAFGLFVAPARLSWADVVLVRMVVSQIPVHLLPMIQQLSEGLERRDFAAFPAAYVEVLVFVHLLSTGRQKVSVAQFRC